MIRQATILSELQSIVGKKHAREPKKDECSVDGMSPRAVVEPGTYEEVAEVLRFANAERLAVIPRGAGMQTTLGNIPTRYDITLSLTRLDKVIEHEPADLTVTCQAGTSIGALNRQLATAGQMAPLSLEADPADERTVGGLLAMNTGELRAVYGGPRDFTIGMKVVTADGRMSRAGGKVVKNVAGYDLCKLYIGSRGTVAVIVEATFKLFPRPEAQQTISLEFADCPTACRVAGEAHSTGLGIADAHLVRSGYLDTRENPYVLHLTLTGKPAVIKRSQLQVQKLARDAGASLLERTRQRSGPQPFDQRDRAEHPLSVRARLLPSRVPSFVRAMEGSEGLLDVAPLVGEVTCILVKKENQQAWADQAMTSARRHGGHAEITGCSPQLKREIDVFGPPPPSFPLMRAIKQQFDPNNILSPGRFVGRL